MPCSGYGNGNQLWRVKFFHNYIPKYNQQIYYFLIIHLKLEGLGKNWAMRNLVLSGIFCKWDCESCTADQNECSSCGFNQIFQENSCFCKNDYVMNGIEPLICSRYLPTTIYSTICELETGHYIGNSLYSPSCRIVKKQSIVFLQCIVNQTIGFPPISSDCYSLIKANFCYIKDYKSQK